MLGVWTVVIACLVVFVVACDSAGMPDGGADAHPGADGSVQPGPDGSTSPDAGRVDGGTPVIPDEHPRIYLDAANRARLTSALDADATAAARFRGMVDDEVDGTRQHYAFRPVGRGAAVRAHRGGAICDLRHREDR